MANLSAIFGGGIKSVQNGTITWASGSGSTATITAVDPTKAFAINRGGSGVTYVELTNATTVTGAYSSGVGAGNVHFTVVELY